MEEPTLRVFETMVLRRIFGTERGEVTGQWAELCNTELNGLYCTVHNGLYCTAHNGLYCTAHNDLYCTAHNVVLGDRIEIFEIGWTCDL